MEPQDIQRQTGWPEGWTPTPQSSNIDAYHIVSSNEDPEIVQLQVIFKNRSRYHYSNLPKDIVEGMRTCESVGKYLNQQIKPLCNDQEMSAAFYEKVDILTGEPEEETEEG